jgi:hypothetical protein
LASDEKCPECGEPLEYDEVDIGVGTIRGNYNCPNCLWNDQVVASDKCLNGGAHSWTFQGGKQCAICLKFKPELPEDMEGVDFGKAH